MEVVRLVCDGGGEVKCVVRLVCDGGGEVCV